MNYKTCTPGEIAAFVAFGLGWWLLASALLYWSWNHVLTKVVNVRPARYWHALLIIFTAAFLCLPHQAKRMHHWHHMKGGHMMKGEKGGCMGCPYRDEVRDDE